MLISSAPPVTPLTVQVGSNALEVYVSRLRKRLAGSGLAIRTLRGLGYRLEHDAH